MGIPKIGVLLFWICYCYAYDEEHLGDLPLENPDLLGGDILGIESFEDRNAVVDKRQVWPGGVVPYVEDPGLIKTVSPAILTNAIWMYKKDTCIRFVPRTTEKDYIRIFPGQGGGYPFLAGGVSMGTVFKNLGHAIGFYHEQNRSDRDDWLTIFWENIKEGMEPQFFKLKPEQNQLLTPFDYDSIMLYGSYTFSKDRRNLKTMVGKNDMYLKDVIRKYFMSKSDILRIKKLYNCENYVYKP
ncbi:astacin-like metalloprotease toxin 1 [Trichonephila inaurata madagascariensis]|uniref:Metalloendopeptidase n=1 Tax=Trichonephila inaurata madagascariensis TaxID=2747483 RepID=A0A8X6MDH0_9ARAC|nr:astacin-like metalloprotease toxin 1 [Trichonephila inaurata madagascariensis]